ncbi:MAG: energy-coupling factor transporter transmembrane component T, partial [Phycisphaerae bacterium]
RRSAQADLVEARRRLRVPALLVTTLALMYRYLFVLVDESQRMRRARQSRTFAASGSGATRAVGGWRSWRTLATVVSQLFVRASERAERIYAAMCARGWDAAGAGGTGGVTGSGQTERAP